MAPPDRRRQSSVARGLLPGCFAGRPAPPCVHEACGAQHGSTLGRAWHYDGAFAVAAASNGGCAYDVQLAASPVRLCTAGGVSSPADRENAASAAECGAAVVRGQSDRKKRLGHVKRSRHPPGILILAHTRSERAHMRARARRLRTLAIREPASRPPWRPRRPRRPCDRSRSIWDPRTARPGHGRARPRARLCSSQINRGCAAFRSVSPNRDVRTCVPWSS